jgi:hypothetical protein
MTTYSNSKLPVNWIDGMKISKRHFLEQNDAFQAMVSDSVRPFIHDFNYGLISGGGEEVYISTDNQEMLTIRALHLNAITKGGHLIQLPKNTGTDNEQQNLPELKVSLSNIPERDALYFVMLTVNPYERVPVGSANPQELPVRLPYTRSALHLSLIQDKDAGAGSVGDYQLPIALLRVSKEGNVFLEDYIPPCVVIGSHEAWVGFSYSIERFFAKIENQCLRIIQKIRQKKQQNEMAVIVQFCCENLLRMVSMELVKFNGGQLHRTPFGLIQLVQSCARLIKNSFDQFIGSGKEEFINYCTDWCEIKQGELEKVLVQMGTFVFHPLKAKVAIEEGTSFIRQIGDLFDKLAHLEYIGKRKETGIFVKEHPTEKPVPIEQKNRENEEKRVSRGSFFLE